MPRARIIRRAPTGAIPIPAGPPPTPAPTTTISRPSATVSVVTGIVTIISGWATAVVATDLIAGWWQSDRLFCVAVGFLTLVFAGTTAFGVTLLLRQQALGRYLIAVGAAVALVTFGAVFVAGARVPWIVYTIPLLQIASGLLAMHPATKRWLLFG